MKSRQYARLIMVMLMAMLVVACTQDAPIPTVPPLQETTAPAAPGSGTPVEFTGVITAMDDDLWMVSGRLLEVDDDLAAGLNVQIGDTIVVRAAQAQDGSLHATSITPARSDDNANDNGDGNFNANGDDNFNANGDDDNDNGDANFNDNGDNDNANGDDNFNSNGDDNFNSNGDANFNDNGDNDNANGDDNFNSNGDDNFNSNGDDDDNDNDDDDNDNDNDNDNDDNDNDDDDNEND